MKRLLMLCSAVLLAAMILSSVAAPLRVMAAVDLTPMLGQGLTVTRKPSELRPVSTPLKPGQASPLVPVKPNQPMVKPNFLRPSLKDQTNICNPCGWGRPSFRFCNECEEKKGHYFYWPRLRGCGTPCDPCGRAPYFGGFCGGFGLGWNWRGNWNGCCQFEFTVVQPQNPGTATNN